MYILALSSSNNVISNLCICWYYPPVMLLFLIPVPVATRIVFYGKSFGLLKIACLRSVVENQILLPVAMVYSLVYYI